MSKTVDCPRVENILCGGPLDHGRGIVFTLTLEDGNSVSLQCSSGVLAKLVVNLIRYAAMAESQSVEAGALFPAIANLGELTPSDAKLVKAPGYDAGEDTATVLPPIYRLN